MSLCICRHSQVTSSPPGSLLGAPACKNVTCQASRMDACSRLLAVVFPFWLCVTARLAGNSCPLNSKRVGCVAVGSHRKPEGRPAGLGGLWGRWDACQGSCGEKGSPAWGKGAEWGRRHPPEASCLGAQCRVCFLDQARPGDLPVTFPPREPGLILTRDDTKMLIMASSSARGEGVQSRA